MPSIGVKNNPGKKRAWDQQWQKEKKKKDHRNPREKKARPSEKKEMGDERGRERGPGPRKGRFQSRGTDRARRKNSTAKAEKAQDIKQRKSLTKLTADKFRKRGKNITQTGTWWGPEIEEKRKKKKIRSAEKKPSRKSP